MLTLLYQAIQELKAAEIHVAENVMNRNFNANSPNSK
jgi:hypothetical protein